VNLSMQLDDGLRRAIADLIAAGSSMRPAMQRIGDDFTAEVQLGFRDGTDPWGNKWAPLSPLTVSRRRGNSSTPLRDNGILGNSITPSNATANSVEVVTMDIRAPTHQFGASKGAYGRTSRGGPIPWGAIPARAFLPIRNNEVDLPGHWEQIANTAVSDHIGRMMGGA
jgi:phage gpG-like protein